MEAALNRLNTNLSLSADELCNLIRSLEMTQPSKTSRHDDVAWLHVESAVLDGYAGFYRRGSMG